MRQHPSEVGQKTEAIILAELVKRDYRVLVPFGLNHRYDFVVDVEGEFIRIQCKTGRMRNGSINFNATSDSIGSKIKGQNYIGQIDVFVMYCPDTDKVYWIPIEDIGSVQRPYLRVEEPKHIQSNYEFRMACDYELTPA